MRYESRRIKAEGRSRRDLDAGGGAFPPEYDGACIAPNTRHSACRWSTVELRGSTFATRAAGDFVISADIWFRPVDMTVGPEGAVYIADWYDYNISHSNPLNRSEWYQPSRLDGRVWRVSPPSVKAIPSGSFDLSKKSSAELIALLAHPNDWYARQARRIFAERRDMSIIAPLTKLTLESSDQRLALEGLWSLYVTGAFSEKLALLTLKSPHEYVRAWTVRLIGDQRMTTSHLQEQLVIMARDDTSVIVRSQLACTAKRLPGADAMAIVAQLLGHDEDAKDVHIPLLLWWAIENKAITETDLVLSLVQSPKDCARPLVEGFITQRLARRFAAEGSEEGFAACARLLRLVQRQQDLDLALTGTLEALSGRKLESIPPPLVEIVSALSTRTPVSPLSIELALRMSVPAATAQALQAIANRDLPEKDRIALIKALGETRTTESVGSLLALVSQDETEAVHVATFGALGYFDQPAIADVVLARFEKFSAASRGRAIELLCSRSGTALKLLEAVEHMQIAEATISLNQVRQLRDMNDERMMPLIAKHWGRVQTKTPLEKQGRITAVSQMLLRAPGDAEKGREYFTKICAKCHKLNGQGESTGPDLTGADRKNSELLVRNVVDPSAMIREQYISHVAQTADGRVLTGLLMESTADTITLLDAENKRTVLNRADVEELHESPLSLMPEDLLDPLNEQQIRDLFAFLQSN
jgi:putative heme-binding domain-containing protein